MEHAADIASLKFVGMGLAAGLIFGGAAQGVARNPSAVGQIRNIAILGVVFAEFMGLLSFVLGIMIMG